MAAQRLILRSGWHCQPSRCRPDHPLTFRYFTVMLPDGYGASVVSLSVRTMVLLACLPLAACAPQIWAKPGGSPAEFEGAKAACNTQSYSMFPPMMQQVMMTQGLCHTHADDVHRRRLFGELLYNRGKLCGARLYAGRPEPRGA